MKKLLKKIFINRNFFLLWQGRLVSLAGDAFFDVALGFWVLLLTGSTSVMSFVLACAVIPKVVLFPISGAISDLGNKKRIMVVTDFIRGVVIVFIGAYSLFFEPGIYMFVIANIVIGVCGAFFLPASIAITPNIVSREEILRANSMRSIAIHSSKIVGKAFGGVLFEFFGGPVIFIINGISFCLSGVSEMFLKLPAEKEKTKVNSSNIIKKISEAVSFLKENKVVLKVFTANFILNFFLSMFTVLLYPLMTPKDYGIGMAVILVGSLMGSILLSSGFLKGERKFFLYIACGIGVALSRVVFLFDNLIVFYCAFFVFGFTLAVINTMNTAAFQTAVSDKRRGSVQGIKSFLANIIVPLGMITGGFLAEHFDVIIIIACTSVFILLSLSPLYVDKRVRDYILLKKDCLKV